jgi:tetratricopeptide (TPR) repeat protein
MARRGALDAAYALATATTTAYPNSAAAFLHLGIVTCLRGDAEGCKKAYAQALELARDDRNVLVALGGAYVQIEDFPMARKALTRALAIDPKYGPTWLNVAVLEIQTEHLDEAETALDRADHLLPDDPRSAYLRGVVLEQRDQVRRALRYYQRAVHADAGNANYLVALALAYERLGRTTSAVRTLDRAIEAQPKNATLRLQQGILLARARHWRQAEAQLLEATRLAPQDPTPWFHVAVVRGEHRHDDSGALDALVEYKNRGGADPVALAWLGELQEQSKRSK